MERNVRYVVLENEEEEDQPAQPVGASATMPSESEAVTEPATETTAADETAPEEPSIPNLPSYSVATDLPSYEEAERTKQEEEARRQREQDAQENASDAETSMLTRMLGWQARSQRVDSDGQLGTDGMFLCTFLLAFVFNWVGLLASMCVTQTIAGRLGAMSGFGLSLVKWVAIFKHSYGNGLAAGDSWLWWLFMVLGFLIFFRGCTQYVRIKYYWHRLNQNVRNNIFYYF